jgi:DNA invertase Pin-like site-specific DNA recombinase
MELPVFACIAEFERELIHERTNSGRFLTKAEGVRFGHRPKLAGDQIALPRVSSAKEPRRRKHRGFSRSAARQSIELWSHKDQRPVRLPTGHG